MYFYGPPNSLHVHDCKISLYQETNHTVPTAVPSKPTCLVQPVNLYHCSLPTTLLMFNSCTKGLGSAGIIHNLMPDCHPVCWALMRPQVPGLTTGRSFGFASHVGHWVIDVLRLFSYLYNRSSGAGITCLYYMWYVCTIATIVNVETFCLEGWIKQLLRWSFWSTLTQVTHEKLKKIRVNLILHLLYIFQKCILRQTWDLRLGGGFAGCSPSIKPRFILNMAEKVTIYGILIHHKLIFFNWVY